MQLKTLKVNEGQRFLAWHGESHHCHRMMMMMMILNDVCFAEIY